jgi:tetratricopeptide (TPR) repeat protein
MSTIVDTLQAGLNHHRAGRLHEAEKMYRRVLEIYPRHARAVHLLGLIAYQVGQVDRAVEYVTAAAQLDRFSASIQADLGEICRSVGRMPEAIAACRRALELDPGIAAVHNCLGLAHHAQGNFEEAIACFRRAVELDPNLAAAHANLGTALRAAGALAEAQVAFERATQLAPDNADNYLSLGVALYDQGNLLDAIACYQKVLRLKPDSIKALYNCALARLALGDFANGCREFEARHAFESLIRRRYALPVWDGTDLAGKSVLVHAEQGLGDTLHFIRYVPLLEERGAKVIVDVQEELIPLLTHSGFKNLRGDGVAPAECEFQIPMLSLPGMLGTTLDTIPAKVPYLLARDELVDAWRATLASRRGFRVGINWQGSKAYYNDRARSIPLRHFAPLAAIGGVRLISLQKKAGMEQLAEVADSFAVDDLNPELDEQSGAFMDTSAVMKCLDLVITSDTATAHLAGALAVPVWVALPTGADWRWLKNRSDSPWYPTMRLSRQPALGAWEEVFAEMADALAPLAARASDRR